jgi:hypothetical protein
MLLGRSKFLQAAASIDSRRMRGVAPAQLRPGRRSQDGQGGTSFSPMINGDIEIGTLGMRCDWGRDEIVISAVK